jgi:hypothetical protein
VLVLVLALGAVVVHTRVVRDRPPLASRPLRIGTPPPPVGSPGRLVWLFQLTGVPCFEAGFEPPGQTTPPPDRDGCDEYQMLDARSGAAVGEGLITRAGSVVLRPV